MKAAPSSSNTPLHINPAAADIWEHALRRFSDDIYESKTLREQWHKAKRHFHRLCKLKEIEPYQRYHQAADRLGALIRKL